MSLHRYKIRGDTVLAEVARQGQATARQFAALIGDLQDTPRAASIGARPFIGHATDPQNTYTAPFAGQLLVYRVNDAADEVELLGVAWLM